MCLSSLSLAAVSYAQTGDGGWNTGTTDPGSIENIFIILFWILVAASVVLLVMAIVSYATAYGDPEVSKKGTQKVLYSALAMAVAIVVRVIPSFLTR
jgi:hypothetical protein